MKLLALTEKAARQLAAFAFVVATIIVLWLTLTPVQGPTINLNHMDKVYHFSAFYVLGVLACMAWQPKWIWAIIGLAALGLGIEVGQYFLPPRSAEFLDWLADTLGAVAGIFSAPFFTRFYFSVAGVKA